MRIICDTAALFKPEEGPENGITVLPLNVTINGETYREYIDIDLNTFVQKIYDGGIPSSSQPSVGEVMDVFESSDEETLAITMADGLSGTYQTFAGVANSMERDNIYVLNPRTLAGPEHYLVQKAIKLNKEGKSMKEILEALEYSIAGHVSFLIPQDFDFLRRGGRLSPLAAKIGALVKIVPVVRESDDGRTLEKFAIKRTYKGAVQDCLKYFKEEKNVDDSYKIYITHSVALERAKETEAMVKEMFPDTETEILELTPVFTTQGGPGCVAIQLIRK